MSSGMITIVVALATGAALLGMIESPTGAQRDDFGSAATTSAPASTSTSGPPATTATTAAPESATTPTTSPTPKVTRLTVVGMTLLQAAAVPTRTDRHPQLVVGSEQVDPSVPPETILSQKGEPDPTVPAYLTVAIAVPPANDCAQAQLAAAYLAGEPGTGNDFGFLLVRDTSTTWCTFSGPVTVRGLAATGRVVTTVWSGTVPVPFELSPGAAIPAPGPIVATTPPMPDNGVTPPGRVQAVVYIGANENGCIPPYPTHPTPNVRVVPATLEVTLPGDVVLTTPNRSFTPHPTGPFIRFIMCQGRFLAGPATTNVVKLR